MQEPILSSSTSSTSSANSVSPPRPPSPSSVVAAAPSPANAVPGPQLEFNRYREKLSKGEFVWTEDEIATLLHRDFKMVDTNGLDGQEFDVLVQDLASAVVANSAKREAPDNDKLLYLANDMFEKAMAKSPKNLELKLGAVAHIISWVQLRSEMEHIIFKGQAIFPLLDRSVVLLQQVLDVCTAAEKPKVMEKVKLIDSLRKKAKALDDCTSTRMMQVLDRQAKKLSDLELLANKLFQDVK